MDLRQLLAQYDEHTAEYARQVTPLKEKMAGPAMDLILQLRASLSLRDIGQMIQKPGGGHYSGQYIWLLETGQKMPSVEFVRALLEVVNGTDDASQA